MEHLNQSIFLWLNATTGVSGFSIDTAEIIAYDLIWIVPIGLIIGWLRGSSILRHALIAATLSGLLGLLINQLIGLVWYHPRPFEAGIGHTLVQHVQDSSFPSDHLTLIWSVAFSFLMHKQVRLPGLALALIGLLVAWARIYLGLHFPFDMLGAAVVAWGSSWFILSQEHYLISPLVRILLRPYHTICAGLIRKGWVNP
jgi:undecaprenyl-diphosphatase